MESFLVEVEADISGGTARFDVVGLPDTAVTESRDRVRSAIKNCSLDFPVSHVTVNLAPADIRKEGPVYDLPILIALLLATRQLRRDVDSAAFIGELSLNGEVRHLNGVLPMVITAEQQGLKEIYIPAANSAEGCVAENITVYPVATVSQLLNHLNGIESIKPLEKSDFKNEEFSLSLPDFKDVKGQLEAKRALEVAAAGGHNLMMIGPPGSGKSMLAARIPSILPYMSFNEAVETTKVFSVAGALPPGISLLKSRPFRAPHHTVSPAGLSGGGAIPRPGELSLAHNGVLFLDELPEFSRTAMEVMRQPIENGSITISRAAGTLSYPCSVMLVCAMNPCPCGFYGHPTRKCTCPNGAPARYLSKVSGPLLDRLDIHIEVPQVNFRELSDTEQAESSAEIRKRVNAARAIQQKRFEGTEISCNARMTSGMTRKYCTLSPESSAMLEKAFERLGLSARAYDKVLKVARTIADLDGAEKIQTRHLAEAIQYRSLDRKFWQNA